MRIDISARQLDTGNHCVCCGEQTSDTLQAQATRTSGKRVQRSEVRAWEFPYCAQCKLHVARWDRATVVGLILLPLGVIFFIFRLLGSGAAPGLTATAGLAGAIGVFVLLRRAAERARKPECVRAGVCVRYLGWDGACQSFDVTSGAYASYLLVANQKKLKNLSPDAARLLGLALASEAHPIVAGPSRTAATVSKTVRR